MTTRLRIRVAVYAAMTTLLIANASAQEASVSKKTGGKWVQKRKAGIEVEVTGIEDDGRAGTKQVVAPTLQWGIGRLELGVKIPFARKSFEGQLPEIGLGDITGSAKLDLATPALGPARPWLSLKLQGPTGDKSAGLGGSPWTLTPALGMSLTRPIGGDVTAVVQGCLSTKLTVSGHAEAREFSGRFTAGLSRSPVDLNIGAETFVPLAGGSGGVNGIVEIKYRLGPTTLGLGFEPRLAGERSPEWKVRFQLGWQL